MACGDTTNSGGGCGGGIEKKKVFTYDNLKYLLSKLSGKICLAVGSIRFTAARPLHLDKTFEDDGILVNGYIDDVTTSASGLMTADDKVLLDNLATGYTKQGEEIVKIEENIEAIEESVSGLKEGEEKLDGRVTALESVATEDSDGLMSKEDKTTLDNLEDLRASGALDSYSIKVSSGVLEFGTTGLSNGATFQLLKGDVVQELEGYVATYILEGVERRGSYRTLTLSDDRKTLTAVVSRENITQRTGYLRVTLTSTSGHSETIDVPVQSTSNCFLLAQGRIGVSGTVATDATGQRLDVEDTYAGHIYHYYKTFDGSTINVRWLTRGRYFLELPKVWEDYFGTLDTASIKFDATLAGIGDNEYARFVVASIHSAGDYTSVGTVSEDCWGAVSIYGAIETDAEGGASDVWRYHYQDAPIRYSIWYNSLAGSWCSVAVYAREDGSKLATTLRGSLAYTLSSEGALWPSAGTYEPTLRATLVLVDESTSEVTTESLPGSSLTATYSVENAPEGVVSIDEHTGVVTLSPGTGSTVQVAIRAALSYTDSAGVTYTGEASTSAYIHSN